MPTNRRTFMKVGALAALTLAAGGGVYRTIHPAGAPQRFVLNGEAKAAIDAMVPAMLAGVLPAVAGAGAARSAASVAHAAAHAEAVRATTELVHGAIRGLPLGAQKEVQDLFGLLALAPARFALTGIGGAWGAATPGQVAGFLQQWRFHRLAMLQTAYHALHDLIIGAWYADPSSWAAIGYPGPMKELA